MLTQEEAVPPQGTEEGREETQEGKGVVEEAPAKAEEPPVTTSEGQPPSSETPQEPPHTLGKIEEETGEQLAM